MLQREVGSVHDRLVQGGHISGQSFFEERQYRDSGHSIELLRVAMGNEFLSPLGPGTKAALLGLGAATQNCLAKVDWPGSAFEGGLSIKGCNSPQQQLVGSHPGLHCLGNGPLSLSLVSASGRGGASGSRGRAAV